ncbi:hypothetical protein ACH5RR_014938 [Cinchona calisaya]|uniref:Phototropic-responsive NPH3 family protein n=1 Tax=Cinchona calisaya TaxID=153742 RepID=A0ABD2ZRR5_9GENT
MCCVLEIDVNGRETFLVDKKILASFSGRFSKMFRKLRDTTSSFKVIFHDFPGGAEGFELIAKFCYNRSKINITPSNIFLLYSAAIYMEMDKDTCGASSLIQQTKQYFKGIHQFAWPELLECLKQCQELLYIFNCSDMFQDFLDCLVGRLALFSVLSPYSSSAASSCMQFSGDISRESTSNYSSQSTTWWFEDLEFLKIGLFEKLVETMVSKKMDNCVISSFLFYYQKRKFNGSLLVEKRRITKTIINLLCLLDRSLISLRGLFDNLRFSLALKFKRCCKKKIENLIGSLLDQAKLDDLLLPSPPGKSYAYDVNLILRLQKQFVIESKKQFLICRLKKVAALMDFYIAEVAPDPYLKPSKFVALATALPKFARDSHDMIYEAMDIYLKVHNKLSMEEKIKICCFLDHDKLSAGLLIHLAKNIDFSACANVTAAVSQHSKLKVLPRKKGHLGTFQESKSCHSSAEEITEAHIEDEDQIVYKNKLNYRKIDSRFRTCMPIAANINKFSICPTKSRLLPGFHL